MYRVKKRFEIAGAHQLRLDYESKCSNIHGHNWIIEVVCESETLNWNGMVYDFTIIKEEIADILDHKFLNDIIPGNPTAENIARWICEKIGDKCVKVSVQESEGNIAEYEPDR